MFVETRKIYEQLASERLAELKRQIQASRHEYTSLCNEIEHILSLNAPEHFNRLTSEWIRLKAAAATSSTVEDVARRPNLDSGELKRLLDAASGVASTSASTSQELELARNIERLLDYDWRKAQAREQAEADELERRRARERAELEAAAAAAAAAAATAAAAAAAAQPMEVDDSGGGGGGVEIIKIEPSAERTSPDKKERKSLESALTKVYFAHLSCNVLHSLFILKLS